MSTGDEKGDDQPMKTGGMVMSQYQRRDMEHEAEKLRKVIAQANEDFAPMKARMAEMAIVGNHSRKYLKRYAFRLKHSIRYVSHLNRFLRSRNLLCKKFGIFHLHLL